MRVNLLMRVFESSNLAIWPMQIVAYLLGALAVFLAFKKTAWSSRMITAVLAFFWLWTGLVFFLLYFAPLRRYGYVFGPLFIFQGLVFAAAVIRSRLPFVAERGWRSAIGAVLIAYSMIGYPLLGIPLGHIYPRAPAFGLTPCPLTIFTFGLLLLAANRVSPAYFALPFLWALAGVVPVSAGMWEDVGMIAGGILATAFIVYRNRGLERHSAAAVAAG